METNKIYQGDCLEIMREFPDSSIDTIITDPPYGYSFMGKDWDKAVPSVKVWQECLRVMKPGAFMFVMSAPRQDVLSQMIVRVGEAGLDTSFTSIYWTYASGFPKASNIGKMVDKRNGRTQKEYTELGKYLKEKRGNKPQKDISKFFPSKTGKLTGCVANWELGLNVPTPVQWKILKKELDLDNRFDELIDREEAEREIQGKDKHFGRKSESLGIGGQEWDIKNKPETSQAKALEGSYGGFQPKPAVEVILVAMKPLTEKTYVDQAMKNRKGITWLDDGRIPYESEGEKENIQENWTKRKADAGFCGDKTGIYGKGQVKGKDIKNYTPQGRFPANLLVSDDVLNDGRITKSGHMKGEHIAPNSYGGYHKPTETKTYSDTGSFSRYFDLDKWWAKTFPFLIVPKASKSEKNKGLEGMEKKFAPKGNNEGRDMDNPKNHLGGMQGTKAQNHHPTVKPIKLMSYLITLASRKDDIVLDPFVGSGTTCIAADQLNRKYIGIDLSREYCDIAEARLNRPQKTLF